MPREDAEDHVGESDKWQGKPLANELVLRLRKEGIAGATVLRGVEGFGAHSRIHTAQILRLSEDSATRGRGRRSLRPYREGAPYRDEMIGDGLVTMMDVTVVHYRSGRR